MQVAKYLINMMMNKCIITMHLFIIMCNAFGQISFLYNVLLPGKTGSVEIWREYGGMQSGKTR
ncbi:MAG: hypothetical protein H6Q67_688 [Firmicutes bacterium]|nr:hypothetical protein [Bacillota bacterium]